KTVAVKSSNDVTRLQALVDKKKVVVTEAAIRDALHLDDTEGVDYFPNEEIFNELARVGYKKPTTKLTFYKAFFSSQWKKINFSKYIFESLVRNVDSSTKFYMYQLGDLSTHSTKYISPALTQKVFANMKRVDKGYSGVETPLFKGILIAKEPKNQVNAEAEGDEEEQGTAAEEHVTAASPPPAQPQSDHFPLSLLQKALDACTALARRVDHLEHYKVAQDLEILKLKSRVKKLKRANKGRMTEESDKDEGAKVVNEQEKTEEVRVNAADAQVEGRQAEIYHINMDHAAKVLSMQKEEELEAHEAVEVVTTAKLITEVHQLKLLFMLPKEEEE
nr:hypothetical protein [Tanacetum cinerariifolium]